MDSKIKILIVDDLPEKLVVYHTILEELGEDLVLARSGAEALKHLLVDDFAVILLDVNMPNMDGYETAALIRNRKRSAHTPIIFVTAYADEMLEMKGYSHGAVDYILSPVVPEVLRTKVRVFVDLFRKTLEVQRQAEILRELQDREHQRKLDETNERLRLALEAGQMGACEWDLGARLLSWSPTLEAIFGFEPGHFSGNADDLSSRLHPEDAQSVMNQIVQAVRTGADLRLEHRIIRINGELAWVELRGRVFKDEDGKASRLAGVCLDITERKRAEAELANYRAHLESLVRQRTAELEASLERLRVSDRFAAIGTLAAGLGHDMGNLLLPVRLRLESLEKINLPEEAREDILAIRTASEYLKRLSQGLRLFALDPDTGDDDESTDLAAWWPDVEPFLRNTLPKGIELSCGLEADLRSIAIPTHAFTQVVYNLVQNAGDAMRAQLSGRVHIGAQSIADGSAVVVSIADDGPGMSEEVKRRCMEPFFTTKTRSISTGLGLALVRGAVLNAKGSVSIESELGRGTTFKLTLPAVHRTDASVREFASRLRTACVNLSDARMRAYVTSVLRSLNVEVRSERWSLSQNIEMLILEPQNGIFEEVRTFLNQDVRHRVIYFGDVPESEDVSQVMCLEPKPQPSKIRATLERAVFGAHAYQGELSS
jgi:PAS domain S-box-containing protein